MTDFLGFASIPAIVVICYLICAAFKTTSLDNKYLPVIAGIAGGILGVVGMLTMNDFPATDYLTAIAVGIASGLAATGVNQIFKISSSDTTIK